MGEETTETYPIDAYEVLAVMVEQFAAISWQKMGLQPDPITGKTAVDLPQARLCVDVTADLCRHLVPQLDAEDKRRMENLVADLRINYVQRAGA